jgi:hypothetical protein
MPKLLPKRRWQQVSRKTSNLSTTLPNIVQIDNVHFISWFSPAVYRVLLHLLNYFSNKKVLNISDYTVPDNRIISEQRIGKDKEGPVLAQFVVLL